MIKLFKILALFLGLSALLPKSRDTWPAGATDTPDGSLLGLSDDTRAIPVVSSTDTAQMMGRAERPTWNAPSPRPVAVDVALRRVYTYTATIESDHNETVTITVEGSAEMIKTFNTSFVSNAMPESVEGIYRATIETAGVPASHVRLDGTASTLKVLSPSFVAASIAVADQ